VQAEYNQQAAFFSALTDESSPKYRMYRASDTAFAEPISEVSTEFNQRLLTSCKCTCSFFSSNMLPCRHICRVLSQYFNKSPFDVCFLPARWRLDSHPLYPVACRRLGLVCEIERPLSEQNEARSTTADMQVAAYQSANCLPSR